jgi:hypothetical protein
MEKKLSLEEFIEFMGDTDMGEEEITEAWNYMYNQTEEEGDKPKYKTLAEFRDAEFEEIHKGVYISLHEKVELGFAPSDLSHYSKKEIREEWKKYEPKGK